MDNNNFNGQNDQLSEQGMQNSGFSLNQYGMENGYAQQPGMNMQQGYTQQPDMNMQQGYVQPDMNMQNPYYQPNMPMNGGNGGSGKPPKVKKPMTKGKIAAIIGGSVALIALIICGVIFIPKIFKPAKDVVVDAFENTFESDKESSGYLEGILGTDDLLSAYYEQGGETSMNITLNSISGMEGISGFGLSADGKYDPVNKLVNGTVSVNYKDAALVTLNLIANEVMTYVQLPDMIDGYFSLPNENYMIALQNSPLGQEMDLEGMPEGNLEYFAASADDEAEIYSGYVDAIEGLWDSVEVEKQGKAKVDVNGKTVTAKEYYVTLKEKDIEEAVCSALDGASQAVLANPAFFEDAAMDEESFTSSMEQVKAMVPSLISGDFVVKVYIADKKVVKVTSSDEISLYGVSMAYDFYFDIDDENASGALKFSVMDEEIGIKFEANDIHGNANGTITAYVPDSVVDVNFNTTVNDTGAASMVEFNATGMYNGSSVMDIVYKNDLNKSDNTFSGSLVCSVADAGDMTLTFAGGLKDVNKGQSYTMYFDSIDMSVNGASMLNIAMEYGISAGNVSASDIDSSIPVYDITTMTETDFENILLDNEDNLANWMNEFYNNSAELGESLNELINTYNGDYADYETEDDAADLEDADEADEEDMVLETLDSKVRILGTVEGFDVNYVCEYFIDFYSDNYSMLEYTLNQVESVDEVMESFSAPSDDTEVYAQEENKTIEVDGETVVYSMVEYDSYGEKATLYRFAREIEPGLYLVADVNIYSADSYTLEQLAGALGNQYYEIVTE